MFLEKKWSNQQDFVNIFPLINSWPKIKEQFKTYQYLPQMFGSVICDPVDQVSFQDREFQEQKMPYADDVYLSRSSLSGPRSIVLPRTMHIQETQTPLPLPLSKSFSHLVQISFQIQYLQKYQQLKHTGNINLQNSQSITINFYILKNRLLDTSDIFSRCSYDGDVCSLKEVAREMETDTSTAGRD